MKHCQQCNLDFPASYRFCGSCGGTLSESVTCDTCGEIVESKWKFCTGCGKSLAAPEPAPQTIGATSGQPNSSPANHAHTKTSAQSAPAPAAMREWYAAPDVLTDGEETTAVPARARDMLVTAPPGNQPQPLNTFTPPRSGISNSRNGKNVPTLTMLSAYGKPEAAVTNVPAPRYAILPGLVLVLFFAAVGFGGWYWWIHRTSAAAAPQPAQASVSNETAPSAGDTPAEGTVTASEADNEWRRLRQERISAQPSDRTAMIAALDAAEKKYASDYRFAYERAKLSIKGITSHHEAFGALADAAEKAIDNGKAQEMLDNLATDKDGDFWKLARGHHEWDELIESLTGKDKRTLRDLHH